jgi:calcineurin-like phosphoesterase family protein
MMRLRLLAAAVSVAILAASGIAAVPFQPVLASVSFLPVADSDVSSSSPTKNYGSTTTLRVRLPSSGTTYRSLLRFAVSGLAGPVTRIRLRLYVTDPTTAGGTVFKTGTSWTEAGVTWKTQPGVVGAALASFPSTTTATWTSVDLPTSLIPGDGAYGLAIFGTTSNQAGYASRQGANPPQLVIDTLVPTPTPSATPSPTPTPTPTPTASPSPTPTPSPSASPTATPSPTPVPGPTPPTGGDPVVLAAGDIACSPTNGSFNGGAGSASACHQLSTSDLILAQQPAAVLALGDLQYDAGVLSDFLASYDSSWGRVKAITHPAAGNHEYQTAGAIGYYTYFGTAAGSSTQGWYSFDVGSWHILALNSNCSRIAGCSVGSPQETWVRADLAAHPGQCTLAYWHHPRYSSGLHGSDLEMQPIWQDLVDAGAALVVSGHDHGYERFAQQDAFATLDPYRGLRQFVVGTGGASHYNTWTLQPNSEVHDGTTFGLLQLTLHASSYDWQFIPDAASGFTDGGTADCHATPPATPDVTPPSTPTGLTATALGPQSVQLGWTPSVDDTAVTLYEVRRDGQVVGSATSTTYLDAAAPSGVAVSYTVRARDAAGNWSGPSSAATVTTPVSTTYLFSDDFESGGLSAWTLVSNLTPAAGVGRSGSWAARSSAATTSAPPSYASRDLSSAQSDVYCRFYLKVESQGNNALDVLKLRTASGTSLAYVLRTSSGMLAVRNNVSGVTTTSQAPISLSVWHQIELHIRVNAAAGSSDAWLDGAPVAGLSQVQNFGSTAVGRVEMGENAASRVYSVLFDDIACSVGYIP